MAAAPATASGETSTEAAPPNVGEALAVHEEWENEEEPRQVDADSALGTVEGSTASITSSIVEYRTLRGRTYHSERYNASYFAPNDMTQCESIDITHHCLTLLLDEKLFLAPIRPDVHKVLDIGTGTGIWAIDFADEFPNAQVIGTDLSPTQPKYVPPNLEFQLDDCTQEWAWDDDTFDFIHIRFLFGNISDWDALFANSFHKCKPGGWVQSCEADVAELGCDDGSLKPDSTMATAWKHMYLEGGARVGNSFQVVSRNLQVQSMKAAGFIDIQTADYKVPISGWARDPKLRNIGQFTRLALENDIEGYTSLLWLDILDWGQPEHQLFLLRMRQELRDHKIHVYFPVRYVWGRKPE